MDWIKILKEEVAKAGSIQAVGDKIGYSRTAVSRALINKYPGGTANIRAKVIATFCDRIICTHTRIDMSQDDCTKHRTSPMPQSNPDALAHWANCQICPFNPDARSGSRNILARRIAFNKSKETANA